METVACNLCGSTDSKLLFLAKDRNSRAEHSFRIVRCTDCRLAYLNPRPAGDELRDYYPSWYHRRDESRPIEETTIWGVPFNEAMAAKSRFIRLHSKPGAILDVGCGDGCLLYYLGQRGWKTQGVEFGETRYGTEVLGLNIFQGAVEDAPFERESFNVVSLFHVLEHLSNPKGTLQHVFGLLKRGGILVLEVPNFGGLEAAIFRRHWVGIDAPRHLYHFTSLTLREMVSVAGFQVVSLGNLADESPMISGYAESLRFTLAERGLYPKPWQQHENTDDESPDTGRPSEDARPSRFKHCCQSIERLLFHSLSAGSARLRIGPYLYLVARRPE